MSELENIFSKDNEIIEILKDYATILDYKKIFFNHLGPELKKIFDSKKDKVNYKNFYEAAQYEYGFFDKEIDLSKAFSLYKKYANLNDYLCMYKMHIIYLCEYEKFGIPLNRVLEKIYLLKCFAYLPNYISDFNLKIFDKIDIKSEIKKILILEDDDLNKHRLFFDLLIKEREKYNLTDNDINLMKGVLFSYFIPKISFALLKSLEAKNELDYSYYHAKNKCVYLRTILNIENEFSNSDIDNFYKEIENKKLYEFYGDYAVYLFKNKINSFNQIIRLLTIASNQGYFYCNSKIYQGIIGFCDFNEIINDYNKLLLLLDNLLEIIVFENMARIEFIMLLGFVIKYSKFSEQIKSKYLVYINEINDYISKIIDEKEKEKIYNNEEYFIFLYKAYYYYFGLNDSENQNLEKANDYFDKATKICDNIYEIQIIEYFKYNIKKLKNELKLVSNDELVKSKKELIEVFYKDLSLKNNVFNCYIIGNNYYEGITTKKDELSAFLIYKYASKILCINIFDCVIKNKIKKFVEEYEKKIEYKIKDEICCICYEKNVDKTFIPCKHNFCSSCVEKLEKNSKCPFCRGDILYVV